MKKHENVMLPKRKNTWNGCGTLRTSLAVSCAKLIGRREYNAFVSLRHHLRRLLTSSRRLRSNAHFSRAKSNSIASSPLACALSRHPRRPSSPYASNAPPTLASYFPSRDTAAGAEDPFPRRRTPPEYPSAPLPDPLVVSDERRTPPSEGCEPSGGSGAGAAAPLAGISVSPRALCLPGGSCGSGRELLFGDGISPPVLPLLPLSLLLLFLLLLRPPATAPPPSSSSSSPFPGALARPSIAFRRSRKSTANSRGKRGEGTLNTGPRRGGSPFSMPERCWLHMEKRVIFHASVCIRRTDYIIALRCTLH